MSVSRARAGIVATATAACCSFPASEVIAGDSQAQSAEPFDLRVEEVIVTARKRDERLQDVPDAVTAFSAAVVEAAGIRQIADFAALTPNLVFQQGSAFRAGFFNLSMRGIGNSQGGWPSVSYLVDGVAADSTDSISSGSLEDIERIEVLRGPQSALYGAGAIAGAINVVTRRPQNELELKGRVAYANGNDREIGSTMSGAIVDDAVLYRLTGSYRDADGLISSSSNGLNLDFQDRRQVQGQLLLQPADDLQIDLRASFIKEKNGSVYQDKLPDSSYIDDFSESFEARRGFPGYDARELYRVSGRVRWDVGDVTLTSVTGYSHTDQHINAPFCYDDPNDPVLPAPGGGAQCLFGPAYGVAALPGQAVDNYFDSLDNLRTVTEDLRLSSAPDAPVSWIVGASGLRRETFGGFDLGVLLAPDTTPAALFSLWNESRDTWWGLYGQASITVKDRFELSLAARYDDNKYENTAYSDRSKSSVVLVPDVDGTPIATQVERADSFQPKAQLSYHHTDDVMSYVTVSRGFRAGYFNTGNFTLPEHTTNYEAGLKTSLWQRRVTANLAVFRIDYSNQQFSTIINDPPFRVSRTIPQTEIDGVELETTWVLSRFLTMGLGMGYLDAQVSDGTHSPGAPRFNASATADFSYPVRDDWSLRAHVDGRYNGTMYLATGDSQKIPAKDYVNARIGIGNERYELALFSRNLTNTRQATIASSDIAGGYIRYQNQPRSYGAEFRCTF